MSKKRKKLNEVFTESVGEHPLGFFTYLETWALSHSIEIPFFADDASMCGNLDNYYHGLLSGEKRISSFVAGIVGDGELTQAKANLICGAWWAVNGMNILKEYNLFLLEYNPIENYDMTESGTDAHTGTTTDSHTGNVTDSHTGTQNITHTGTQNTSQADQDISVKSGYIEDEKSGKESSKKTGTESHDITDKLTVNAFDSSSPSDYSTHTIDDDLSFTGRSDELEFTNRKDTTTFNNVTDTESHNSSIERSDNSTEGRSDNLQDQSVRNLQDQRTHNDTMTHSLSRHGNIGVTTAQRMLGQERNLWLWNFFIKYLFPTVDAVLTVPYY